MDELPDDVMAEIREHVQSRRRTWEGSLRVPEDQKLLEVMFGEEREHP
jgi:hypothetical protein